MSDYDEFIAAKLSRFEGRGIDVADLEINESLFPHQIDLVRWALAKGRAAVFADTGLGKTAIQLEWARHVSTRGRVLVLAPLAVAQQTEREAARLGIECAYERHDTGEPIVVTNYDRIHLFDPSLFAGVVLDESSILKSYDGATCTALIEAFSRTPFRLACTATPAPNDFTELGNHSEFLGAKTRVEMLAEFFCHDGGSTQDWRLKGHARRVFWEWVASWGAVVRSPADLGHDASAYTLPALRWHAHSVGVDHSQAHASGSLLLAGAGLAEQRAIRRSTVGARVEAAAALVDNDRPAVIWCELNDEGDALAAAIPGSVNVAGADSSEEKERKLADFSEGRVRVMISKPKIAGFGLNWQHCANVVFVGASHSYEQTYQAVRRCWRFGQRSPVDVHVIAAETDAAIVDNYRKKEAAAALMFDESAPMVRDAVRASLAATSRSWNEYSPKQTMEIPSWLT